MQLLGQNIRRGASPVDEPRSCPHFGLLEVEGLLFAVELEAFLPGFDSGSLDGVPLPLRLFFLALEPSSLDLFDLLGALGCPLRSCAGRHRSRVPALPDLALDLFTPDEAGREGGVVERVVVVEVAVVLLRFLFLFVVICCLTASRGVLLEVLRDLGGLFFFGGFWRVEEVGRTRVERVERVSVESEEKNSRALKKS